jgi:hypothetical protein
MDDVFRIPDLLNKGMHFLHFCTVPQARGALKEREGDGVQ